jgi:hypothetical protein
MKEFLVAVAKHVATPAKVVGKGIASNMVKAGATALAMGGAPLSYPSPSAIRISGSPPSSSRGASGSWAPASSLN